MSALEYIPPEQLHEAEGNPRRIRNDRFEHLCQTIAARPDLLEARPLILDAVEGDIVAGNMRLRAAKALLSGEALGVDLEACSAFEAWIADRSGIPVFRKTFADASERREWLTLDNQGFGEWVPEEVAALIAAHAADGGDMALLGFTETERDGLLALLKPEPQAGGLDGADPDAVPAPPAEPITQPGDLWILGAHRLLCASAEHRESYEQLLHVEGEMRALLEVPACVWTDPPYGVDYDPESRPLTTFSADRDAKPFGVIAGDDLTGEVYAEWLTTCLRAATEPLDEGGAVYVMHADKMAEWAMRAYREAGLHFAQQLLWIKSRLVFGRGDYQYIHEPLIYGWKPGAAHAWLGDRKQTTVFEVPTDHYAKREEGGYVHANQKPYDLIRPMLENSTSVGELVLDPFGGSGSTLVVCEQIERRCRTLELSPAFCDVIVERWETFTGRSAQRVRLT